MSTKKRLDQEMVSRGLCVTRSQAENYIKLSKVLVNKKPITKAGYFVGPNDEIIVENVEQLVSRAGLKLASVAPRLGIGFENKIVLDVGSSTGGFTDYALHRDAKKVIAVDVGTDQLHPSLRDNPKIELHEKTDIRDFVTGPTCHIDVVLIDVSFISLREILPAVAKLSGLRTLIVAMVKPQFEAGKNQTNKGLIKNDSIRRTILKEFEEWAKDSFEIIAKADSEVAGAKGNLERFYSLKTIPK
jgi:23S rRNA (cytidine1920-2'-O)/16S rRNA (cytidine1409-2'-O)-methyltransferase